MTYEDAMNELYVNLSELTQASKSHYAECGSSYEMGRLDVLTNLRSYVGECIDTCKAENNPADERNYSDGITISVDDNTASKRASKPYGLCHYIDDKILATFVVDKKDESILFYIGEVLKNVRDER